MAITLIWKDARHKRGEGIVALQTDSTNSFLFTDDSAGYLKVWDIHMFTNGALPF